MSFCRRSYNILSSLSLKIDYNRLQSLKFDELFEDYLVADPFADYFFVVW